jgi:O-methyltransferase involved in polyketide biosynthesis
MREEIQAQPHCRQGRPEPIDAERQAGHKGFDPPGLVEATKNLLVASGVAGERTVRWMQSPRMAAFYGWFDWMLPGQFEAFAYRKMFCEQQVRAGIDEGAAQILILGAGYDTLGWRLAGGLGD